MNKKIIVTFLARFGSAAAAFVIAILLSQVLGTEGKGKAALLILNISFINLFTNIMGGAAVVYLAPRFHNFTLLLVSYIWMPFVALILALFYYIVGYEVQGLDTHAFILATILGGFNTNTNLLLGKRKTDTFNILTVLQVFITLIYLLVAFYGLENQHYNSYVNALYFGYTSTFLLSLFFAVKEIEGSVRIEQLREVIARYIKHGGYIQLANLGQLLIYRASYYLLTFFHGLSPLGIYSNAIALAESIWIVSRSISTIQYSEISNEKSLAVSKQKTVKLRNTNLIITFLLIVVLCFLPDSFYTYLFGRDFKGLQEIIWYLSPGIVAFSYNNINAHLFSGLGKNYINTIISFTGFAFTAVIGFLVIPSYSSIGAAATSSLVFILTAAMSEYYFRKTN